MVAGWDWPKTPSRATAGGLSSALAGCVVAWYTGGSMPKIALPTRTTEKQVRGSGPSIRLSVDERRRITEAAVRCGYDGRRYPGIHDGHVLGCSAWVRDVVIRYVDLIEKALQAGEAPPRFKSYETERTPPKTLSVRLTDEEFDRIIDAANACFYEGHTVFMRDLVLTAVEQVNDDRKKR